MIYIDILCGSSGWTARKGVQTPTFLKIVFLRKEERNEYS